MLFRLFFFICLCAAISLGAQKTATTPPFSQWTGRPSAKITQLSTDDGGLLSITTTKRLKRKESDILLTKTDAQGNEVWFKRYGGTSYERASSIQPTADGGYIIIGSTSSYGAGNYDVLLVKIDAAGKSLWQRTYGGFYNEYGYLVQETDRGGFLLEGTQQICNSKQAHGACEDRVWGILTDAEGNLLEEALSIYNQ